MNNNHIYLVSQFFINVSLKCSHQDNNRFLKKLYNITDSRSLDSLMIHCNLSIFLTNFLSAAGSHFSNFINHVTQTNLNIFHRSGSAIVAQSGAVRRNSAPSGGPSPGAPRPARARPPVRRRPRVPDLTSTPASTPCTPPYHSLSLPWLILTGTCKNISY